MLYEVITGSRASAASVRRIAGEEHRYLLTFGNHGASVARDIAIQDFLDFKQVGILVIAIPDHDGDPAHVAEDLHRVPEGPRRQVAERVDPDADGGGRGHSYNFV